MTHDTDVALKIAMQHHQSGAFELAGQCYLEIIKQHPEYAPAYYQMGLLAKELYQTNSALNYLSEALERDSACPYYWIAYIDALLIAGDIATAESIIELTTQQGLSGPEIDALIFKSQAPIPHTERLLLHYIDTKQFSDALLVAQQLTIHQPQQALGWKMTGYLLNQQQCYAQALTPLQQAITLNEQDSESYCNLGFAQYNLAQYAAAQHSYEKAIQYNPLAALAYYGLALLQHQANQIDAAAKNLERVLEIQPDFAEALGNLGFIRQQQGRMTEAENFLLRAIQIKPDYATAYNNLGTLYQSQKRFPPAEHCYKQALAHQPDYAQAHNNLGALLQDQSRFIDAEACYRQALIHNPNSVDAHTNLAASLLELGRAAEAKEHCLLAIAQPAHNANAHLKLAITSAYLSDFDQVVAQTQQAQQLRPYTSEEWEQHLYIYSYHPDLSAAKIYQQFVNWGDRFAIPNTNFAQHHRTHNRRLRIGYVSPDFRKHTSRFYFYPLFNHHNKQRVELFAYSNVLFEDQHTTQFKKQFEHWRNIRHQTDEQVAAQIKADKIDILVDACNHMRDDRLGVFTLKPAPIQATWLGAAWTTGLPMVDYAIIDPYMAPEGTLTREKIVRLPHSFVAYQPPENTPEVADTPCLKNGHITFIYSGRSERLNHRTFRVWGEILRKLPSARLILDFRAFTPPDNQRYYQAFMLRHGMNPEQVIMRNSSNIFEGLADADILLDSFPHSGGTMLFDGIWMGLPFLTLAERPPVGRIGCSILSNLKLNDWIAYSEQEYIEKACAFALQTEQISQLRQTMRQRMQTSPIMDGKNFAHEMEEAFEWMFEQWQADAHSISVIPD